MTAQSQAGPLLVAASSSPLTDEAPPPWLAETTTSANRAGEWRISPEEVELLSGAADDNYAIDQQFGANRLWRPTRAHLLWTHHMIDRGIYDDALGQSLHALAGKLTTSLGWFCYDAGLQAQARQYFSEALNAANYTSDDVLASRTLSNMARQAVDLNKGREAVRFAKLQEATYGRMTGTPPNSKPNIWLPTQPAARGSPLGWPQGGRRASRPRQRTQGVR